MKPVVGYPGGKRRLLPALRPYFDPSRISVYVEPFVGMGAVYLDLRSRGYRGKAVLADSNTAVADFWAEVHAGEGIVREAERLCGWPVTEDAFWRMMDEPVEPRPERAARFLWLTNFMYANLPPTYTGTSWKAARSSGTKIKSMHKWGKTFPWSDCVSRLKAVSGLLVGAKCEVRPEGLSVLSSMAGHETVFADPPYVSRAKYEGNGRATTTNFMSSVFKSIGRVVLTEMELREAPVGWVRREASVLSRQAGPFQGAGKERIEYIYSSFIPPNLTEAHR